MPALTKTKTRKKTALGMNLKDMKWGIEKYPVSVQDAVVELERIKTQYGSLTASEVIAESASPTSVLHNCFEWDNDAAAEKFRVNQAKALIRNVQFVMVQKGVTYEGRALVNIKQEYYPIPVVVQDYDSSEYMLKQALRELQAFQQKYSGLKALGPIFPVIDQVIINNNL